MATNCYLKTKLEKFAWKEDGSSWCQTPHKYFHLVIAELATTSWIRKCLRKFPEINYSWSQFANLMPACKGCECNFTHPPSGFARNKQQHSLPSPSSRCALPSSAPAQPPPGAPSSLPISPRSPRCCLPCWAALSAVLSRARRRGHRFQRAEREPNDFWGK